MGNIRPSFIKIRAIALVEQHGDKFTDDFDHNKIMVSQLTDVGSKKLRNWIAGYVTRSRQSRVACGLSMPVRIDWDRQPVSIHSDDKAELESLIDYLKTKHSIRKRSIIMKDRESGGFLFFIYQPCDPRWIAEFYHR